MKYTRVLLVAALAASAGCKAKQEALVYQAIPVSRRDIVVSAQAAGSIQPDTTVDVKSLASGEVTSIKVQTGQVLQAGTLMVEIDRRQAKNAVDQSEAQYEQAKAQLTVAEAAKRRADTLFAQQAMTEADHDQAIVNYATARANLVTARVNNENNIIALSQTEVRAPITGMVISQNVDRGSMIAATGKDVSGGTTLFQMANMSLVQVHTLVDETDIGKIQPGQSTTVTVDAFPNHPFDGYVMKIEPRDTVSQNVTMFPVLVRIDNKDGILRPGMNSEVEIHVGQRQNVLAAPNAALRTDRDYVSAAQVLNLDPATVASELAASDSASQADASQHASLGAAGTPGKDQAAGAHTMTMPNGTTIKLPDGVTEQQVNAAFQHMRQAFQGGGAPSADDRALLQKVRSANPDMMGSGRRGGGNRGGGGSSTGVDSRLGGSFIVFVKRGDSIRPVRVRTGLTDLEYSEVISGLQEGDSVLVLPSASLVQSQQDFKERINRFTGGGSVPGMKATPAKPAAAPAAGGGGGNRGGGR
ncbi:MAG TPA: efflux RND transporter periplasmic adaptor subunit [Gemmatimonadales bacterium]|nr:efflux RND transporter periplasmic adaptor subunit [Gemmatimonadales bacterium]